MFCVCWQLLSEYGSLPARHTGQSALYFDEASGQLMVQHLPVHMSRRLLVKGAGILGWRVSEAAGGQAAAREYLLDCLAV